MTEVHVRLERNLTGVERTTIVALGNDEVAITQMVGRAFIVFRESRPDAFEAPWLTDIPGFDHVGLAWEDVVFESHPRYPPGRYLESKDADADDYLDIAARDGVQAQHSRLTFSHDSTLNKTDVIGYEEFAIDGRLGDKIVQKIEEKLGLPYATIDPHTREGLLDTLSPSVQKGGGATGGFTCVGLIEWAAEQVGHNSGQGFLPAAFESFRMPDPRDLTKLIDVPLLSPALLDYALTSQWLLSNPQWLQGLLDPVDFLVTDPLGRRLGFVQGVGLVREIPNAFYPGDGKVEQFLIPQAIPGVYTIQLVGLGSEAFAAFGSSTTTRSFSGVLGSGETESVRFTIEPRAGSLGDVNGDGHVSPADVTALISQLNQTTSGFHPGDLDGDSVLTNADVTLLRALVSSLARPILDVMVDDTSLEAGETMTLGATLVPGSSTEPVDVYIALRLPTGQFFSLQLSGSLVPGIVPIARRLAPFNVSGTLLQYRLNGGEPKGMYTWYSALTEPGTVNLVSPLIEVPFTIR